ncbi:MAG: hypothetical protein ABJB97_05870, partial [Acidobacteriota bacterium]
HYTFSRARDNGQNSQTFTATQSRINPFDPTFDNVAPSPNDIPHRFVVSAVWQPGVPSGLQDSAVGRALFRGWTLAPIFVAQSGNVYTANVTGTCGGISGGFTCSGGPARNLALARNSFRQPRIVNLDMRLSRRFHIKESMNFELLGEAFNVFNRFQVTGINFTQYAFSGNNLNFVPAFGSVFSAGNSIYRERQVQLAARFEF